MSNLIDPYAYCGGHSVDNYNDWEVEDFTSDNNDMIKDYISKQTSYAFDPNSPTNGFNHYEPGTPYDSIFGLGKKRQAKKAEKKIAKAAIQLEKGNVKGANRKLAKGQAILAKIQKGQTAVQTAQQQAQDVRDANDQLAINQASLNQPLTNAIQPLSVSPMSEIGSSSSGGGGGFSETAGNIGADSAAPSTAINPDEPTGWLSEEKELGGVTVIGKKSDKNKMLLIAIAAVILIVALVYFAPKFLKKK